MPEEDLDLAVDNGREDIRTGTGAAPPAAQAPKTVTISQAEFDRMTRERDEAKESEKYWADRARGTNETAPPAVEDNDQIDVSDLIPKPEVVTGAAAVDEAIYNDPDKWLKAVADGPKAIEALIKKQGYTTPEQVAEIAAKVAARTVQVERTKISTDAKLMEQFPELRDKQSEFFKACAEEYQELIAFDPAAKNSPATIFAAAKTVRAKLDKSRPSGGDYDSRYDRAESDRQRRIEGQDGSRGGRGPRSEETVSTLGPEARAIAKAMGVTDDEVLAEKRKLDNGRVGRRR